MNRVSVGECVVGSLHAKALRMLWSASLVLSSFEKCTLQLTEWGGRVPSSLERLLRSLYAVVLKIDGVN